MITLKLLDRKILLKQKRFSHIVLKLQVKLPKNSYFRQNRQRLDALKLSAKVKK
jgi:hypothetical protein